MDPEATQGSKCTWPCWTDGGSRRLLVTDHDNYVRRRSQHLGQSPSRADSWKRSAQNQMPRKSWPVWLGLTRPVQDFGGQVPGLPKGKRGGNAHSTLWVNYNATGDARKDFNCIRKCRTGSTTRRRSTKPMVLARWIWRTLHLATRWRIRKPWGRSCFRFGDMFSKFPALSTVQICDTYVYIYIHIWI